MPSSPQLFSSRRRSAIAAALAAGGIATGAAFAIVSATSADAVGGSAVTPSSASATPSSASATSTPAAQCNPGDDLDGRITAVSSTSLTVRDLFGTSRTYAITSTTRVHEGPQRVIAVSSLAKGEQVHVRGSKGASTYTAQDVDVHPATIDGQVVSVDSASIIVTDRDGFTRTIVTGSATTYTSAGKTVSRSTITAGGVIHAEGTVDPNGTSLDADSVVKVTRATGLAGGPRGGGPRPAAGLGGCAPGRGAGHHGPMNGGPGGGAPGYGVPTGRPSGVPKVAQPSQGSSPS